MGLCSSSETFDQSTNAAQGGLRGDSSGGSGGAGAAAAMMGGNNLSSRVELFISCQNLKNLDSGSLSDCFCVVEEMNHAKQWVEVGRSEIIQNSLNPEFVTAFKYTYKFEESQKIRVKLYDADNDAADTNNLDLSKQDYAGETAVMYLGDIVSAANHPAGGKSVRLQGRTKHGQATGTCMVRCEEMANQNGVVTLMFCAKGLSNLDGMFGKSDPFLRMSRTREIGKPLPMFRSEVVMNNLSPKWAKIKVSLSALCNGDPYRTIEFEVADYDSDGSHDFIGTCQASLNDLVQSVGTSGNQREMQLTNTRTGKKTGLLICTWAEVKYEASFLDYIMGGTEVNFMVAVDFTASNGRQVSLHVFGCFLFLNCFALGSWLIRFCFFFSFFFVLLLLSPPLAHTRINRLHSTTYPNSPINTSRPFNGWAMCWSFTTTTNNFLRGALEEWSNRVEEPSIVSIWCRVDPMQRPRVCKGL